MRQALIDRYGFCGQIVELTEEMERSVSSYTCQHRTRIQAIGRGGRSGDQILMAGHGDRQPNRTRSSDFARTRWLDESSLPADVQNGRGF